MSEDKILAGESSDQSNESFVIGTDRGSSKLQTANGKALSTGSLTDRIVLVTESGGFKTLPEDFDDENGDWKVINSSNPFEVLYLDYKQYKFISPEIVKNQFAFLEKFWKSKYEIMNTGGNRIAFKSKYGEGTIENCLTNIKRAFDKIQSSEGIQRYFTELNNARLQKGEEALKDSIEHMMLDGSADRAEIQLCFERGIKYELTNEETALILNKRLELGNFKPYGNVSGSTLVEKLLSIDSWMTAEKITEAETIKREKDSLKIQILPGKYATTIAEVGTILFNDPVEAKEIIKEDLLKQVIAQKDIVLAREISTISKSCKDLNSAFLQIVYKLNNSLPFPFVNQQKAKNILELTSMIFENDQTLKSGKDDLKKGYIENWLKETDKQAHTKLISIRDTAENFEQAFLAMLYSFNPSLPYRFASNILVKNVNELSVEIQKNSNNWNGGKTELYNGSIITWLQNTGHVDIVNKWENLKNNFKSKDIGLEEFIHILNSQTEYSKINTDITTIDYPVIQSGKIIQTVINLSLKNRGYSAVSFSFSKELPGVYLSEKNMDFNAAADQNMRSFSLSINSALLLKGVDYNTSIIINTSANQKLEIPVSFRIVFPKNAFILESLKYAGIVSAFFVLVRLIISSGYPDWLNTNFNFFLQYNSGFGYTSNFSIFGWSFFLFLACIITGIYFLTKYLSKDVNKK